MLLERRRLPREGDRIAEWLMVYNGKSYSHGWFQATPILGNHQNCVLQLAERLAASILCHSWGSGSPYFITVLFELTGLTNPFIVTIWFFNIAMENHHAINR